jgi:phosphoglucomutase
MKMRYLMLMLVAVVVIACGQESGEDGHSHGEDDTGSWAVTAWGEHFGLFPEFDALVAGETASSMRWLRVRPPAAISM